MSSEDLAPIEEATTEEVHFAHVDPDTLKNWPLNDVVTALKVCFANAPVAAINNARDILAFVNEGDIDWNVIADELLRTCNSQTLECWVPPYDNTPPRLQLSYLATFTSGFQQALKFALPDALSNHPAIKAYRDYIVLLHAERHEMKKTNTVLIKEANECSLYKSKLDALSKARRIEASSAAKAVGELSYINKKLLKKLQDAEKQNKKLTDKIADLENKLKHK